jgi:RNA polymerase sigma-70 factor (ECF subfamily)
VFLRALESLPRYRWTGAPFRAWLYRIAHNLVVDLHRRRTRHPVGVLDDGQVDPGRLGDPDGWLQEKVARGALPAAVDDLTALQRRVILLKFAAGLSNAEVAVVLERTEGAVKAVQHAAVVALRRCLTDLAPGDAAPAVEPEARPRE